MENLKHTPGPWHIGMKPGPMIYGPNGEQVTDMRGGVVDLDEHRANVKLIARSPELADLLRRVAAIAPATSGADALALCDELETLQAEARILLTACS